MALVKEGISSGFPHCFGAGHSEVIDQGMASMGSNENVAPKVMNQVLKQLAGLQESKLDGIRYLQNDEDPLDIQAELEGPDETPYEGTSLRRRRT